MKRALIAVLAFFVVGSALGQSPEPAKIRITTWNLEWFPNGSPHETAPEKQAQRIEAAADVLKKLDPDILLLQEMRDYDACARLYHFVIAVWSTKKASCRLISDNLPRSY